MMVPFKIEYLASLDDCMSAVQIRVWHSAAAIWGWRIEKTMNSLGQMGC